MRKEVHVQKYKEHISKIGYSVNYSNRKTSNKRMDNVYQFLQEHDLMLQKPLISRNSKSSRSLADR